MAAKAIDLTLSNSKVKTWRRCPNQFRYKYEMKLQPKEKSLPLERGSWLHLMLQYHYDGMGWKNAWEELKVDYDKLYPEEKEQFGDLPAETARIMRAYLKHYQSEDQRFRVVDSEVDEIITLPNGLRFNFIIDLIVEDLVDGGLWLWDHKTVGKFMEADFLLLDAQLTRYHWCAEHMGYTPLNGVVFNELRTKAPTVPRLLKKGGLSQAKNIDTDLYTYYREIKRHGLNPNDYTATLQRLARRSGTFFRRTKLPKDKPVTQQMMSELTWSAKEILRAQRTDEFPRTPEKSCRFDCDFKDLCQTELFGGDIKSIIKFNFQTRSRRGEEKAI